MLFDWIIDNTILWLLPSFRRKALFFAYLKGLLSPVQTLFNQFLIYRKEQIYEAYLTGQTIQIRRLLNDRFDDDLRRIIIVHSVDTDLILYLDGENQPGEDVPLYLDGEDQPGEDVPLYLDGEPGTVLPFDFRVIAPLSLQSSEDLIASLVRKYALASKTFDILFV